MDPSSSWILLSFTPYCPMTHHILLILHPKYTLNRSISVHLQGYHASPNHPFHLPLSALSPIIYSSHSNQKDLFDVNHITSLSHFQQLNSFPITSTTLKGMVSEPPVFLIDHAILCSSPQTQEFQVHASSPFKVFIFAVPSA